MVLQDTPLTTFPYLETSEVSGCRLFPILFKICLYKMYIIQYSATIVGLKIGRGPSLENGKSEDFKTLIRTP